MRSGAARERLREARLEHERLIRRASLEPIGKGIGARQDANDLEQVRRRESAAQLERGDVRCRIHDEEPDAADIGAQREAEEHYLRERQQQQDQQRLPVAQNVVELLDDESAKCVHCDDSAGGRASWTKTSSMVSVANSSFSSCGVPSATIRPATMIDTRSQYSASSM